MGSFSTVTPGSTQLVPSGHSTHWPMKVVDVALPSRGGGSRLLKSPLPHVQALGDDAGWEEPVAPFRATLLQDSHKSRDVDDLKNPAAQGMQLPPSKVYPGPHVHSSLGLMVRVPMNESLQRQDEEPLSDVW